MTNSAARKPAIVRYLILLLSLVLAFGSFGGLASAADTEIVLRLDLNKTGPLAVVVEGDGVKVEAETTISTTSAKKNVTDEATWTSNSSSIKVIKGMITATAAVDSATVTAKYQGFTASVTVNSSFEYDEMKLKTVVGSTETDTPDKLNASLGDKLEFAAYGLKSPSPVNVSEDATWTSSNTAVATVDDGEVTLLIEGTTTISVKHKGRTDSVALTVVSPYEELTLKDKNGNVITDPIEGEPGAVDVPLRADVTYKAGSSGPTTVTDDASWTTSNSSVVTVSKGVVKLVGNGMAVVTAKRYGESDSVTFIVRSPFEAMKVTPEQPIAVTLYGNKVELTASTLKGINDAIPVTNDAEWKVADALIAAIVKENGKVYVQPKGVGATKVTVSYKGTTKEIPVTVYPTITKVEIAKDELDLFLEDNVALPAVSGTTVSDEKKDISKLVKWTSDDEDVVSIEEDGKIKALAVGKATLTAEVTNEDGATRTDTLVVDVHKKLLTLVPDTTAVSVVIGKEVDLPPVKAIYEDGTEEIVTSQVTWKSSSANLLVKPPKMKGLYAASVTLTGTFLGKTVIIKVQVEEEFVSFQITPTALQLTLNRSSSIRVVGTNKSGKKVTLTTRVDWNTTKPELVTINGSSVKGAAEGSGELTASVQGKPLKVPFVVTAKLVKITASEKSFEGKAGEQVTIGLIATYENGKTVNIADAATWTTSSAKVATVKDGVVNVLAKGSTSIKAAFGGKTTTLRVTVK